MKLELKDCPFCGESDDLSLYSKWSYKTKSYFIWAECGLCGCRSKAFGSDEDPTESDWSNTACNRAIKSWNRRVTVDA